MTEVVAGIAAVASAATLAGAAVWAKALLRYRGVPVSAPGEFSPQRYAALRRLCSNADLEFLRSLPSYRPETGKAFRANQRRIVRLYLKELTGDFRRLHAAARALAAEAPEEHADLVPVLMRQQVVFWVALARIEARLTLSHAGVEELNLNGLFDAVEAIRAATAVQSPAPAAI